MRQSKLFSKTRKETPKDEVSKNAKLLIRGGFIAKEMAGVYSYLPLGLRVLNKINGIIREEMNKIGGEEIFLSALQDKETWQKTNRWSDEAVDIWFKSTFKNGTEVGLGFTHEEPLTKIMKDHIHSFRDLPIYAYQIQTKFRNESRAKSGLMRCREFLMKDLYSFSRNNDEHNQFYEKAKSAYKEIFKRVGLGEITYITFASGGSFSKYSHEFQTVSPAGEDVIYVSKEKNIAINKEVLNEEVLKDLGVKKEELVEEEAIEVGNIFCLGTKFSDALGLNYVDEKGLKQPVVMGSYGIGPGRLMGAIAESLGDEKGVVWPKSISPFAVHLIEINPKKDAIVSKKIEDLYNAFLEKGIEVLFDDREVTAGAKFADADLVGIPMQVVVSERNASEDKFEIKDRKTGALSKISKEELFSLLKN